MKKILLSLLLAGGVNNSFAMQAGGADAQGGAAGSASAATGDDNLSPVNKALFSAARSGDLEGVLLQLANGANVNAQNSRGGTALMCAAHHSGHVGIIQGLIAGGADVNAQNDIGSSALMFAAYNGHIEVVRELLANGANVNAQCAEGVTALIYAAQERHVEVVRELLTRSTDVNTQNAKGVNALMFASAKGDVEVVQVLLYAGAEVNAQNAKGWTALMAAAKNGHVGVVQALIERCADVNVKSSENTTAMNYASGKPEIIALLQAHKASQAAQAASAKPVPSKAAAAKGKGKAAAAGGVARAGGGATSQPAVNPKLCTSVVAKILADAKVQTDDKLTCDALTQTDELVQILPSGAQKRLASRLVSKSGSAFTRPKPTVVPTGAASTTTAEQVSSEIMRPIARRPQGFASAGMQAAMTMPVAPQMPLKPLIAQAVSNGTGLFGLIELLASCDYSTTINAHEAEQLLQTLGFDATVFAEQCYAPITGAQLAQLLDANINLLFNRSDETVDLTPQQESTIELLFAQVVSLYFS